MNGAKDRLSLRTIKRAIQWDKRKRYKKLILKSIAGYILGLILTYFFFIFFTITYDVSISISTGIACVLAVIWILGLSYSREIQCITVLLLPNLFTVKGRSFLVVYALLLVATGPTKNIFRNTEIISDCLACIQDHLKSAIMDVIKLMKKPLLAIKEVVVTLLQEFKKVLRKVEKILTMIRDTILEIFNDIEKAFKWLGGIVNVCNEEYGTPFQRCINMTEDARKDCDESLPDALDFLCDTTYIMDGICYSVKFIDYICELVDFISDGIIAPVKHNLAAFTRKIQEMFYVSVKYEHEYRFEMITSRSMRQVGQDIIDALQKKFYPLIKLFNLMKGLAIFTFLRIFLKAFYYRYKYMNSERFDNKFITKAFIELDNTMKGKDMETILPLKWKEKRQYVQLRSCKLLKKERQNLLRQATFLIITSVQIAAICAGDYAIFWVLRLIRDEGKKLGSRDVPPLIKVDVEGTGFVAEVCNGIANAFRPITKGFHIDSVPCLPNPSKPDVEKYVKIACLLLLCWIFLICEPYGLRLRQIIMANFYPERAKERAIWLHNHMILKRTNFVQMSRRYGRKKYKKDGKYIRAQNLTCLDWLRAKTDRCWIMRKILGRGTKERCMLCAKIFNEKDERVHCLTPGCSGLYCPDCFEALNRICFICHMPLEYGDLSDVSEEQDSSDFTEVVTDKKVADIEKKDFIPDKKETELGDKDKSEDTENKTGDISSRSEMDNTASGESTKTLVPAKQESKEIADKDIVEKRKKKCKEKHPAIAGGTTADKDLDGDRIPPAGESTNTPEDVVTGTEDIKETDIPKDIEEADIPRDIKEADIPKDIEEADIPRDIKETDIPKDIEEADIPKDIKETDIPKGIKEADIPEDVMPKAEDTITKKDEHYKVDVPKGDTTVHTPREEALFFYYKYLPSSKDTSDMMSQTSDTLLSSSADGKSSSKKRSEEDEHSPPPSKKRKRATLKFCKKKSKTKQGPKK